MALLTVEIPESLLTKLQRTGRPAQEIIVEALEETLPSMTIAKIMESLQSLSSDQLPDVLQFIQFLQYKPLLLDDSAEDEALWEAVEANQLYDQQHPDEPLIRFKSGEEFLEATTEW